MKAEDYTHQIPNGIKEKDAQTLQKINAAIVAAFEEPETIKKISAGFYVVVIGAELVTMQHSDEYSGSCKWLAEEYTGKWASMLYPTLKELKSAMGIS